MKSNWITLATVLKSLRRTLEADDILFPQGKKRNFPECEGAHERKYMTWVWRLCHQVTPRNEWSDGERDSGVITSQFFALAPNFYPNFWVAPIFFLYLKVDYWDTYRSLTDASLLCFLSPSCSFSFLSVCVFVVECNSPNAAASNSAVSFFSVSWDLPPLVW